MMYRSLWDRASGSINYGPLLFLVIQHEDRAFSHHLELVNFPSDFIFFFVLGQFLRDDDELGRSGGLLDLFES